LILFATFKKPSSLPWLLKYELLLLWRGMGGKKVIFISVTLGLLWLAFHVLAWFMLFGLNKGLQAGGISTLPPRVLVIIGLVFWSFFTISFSYSVAQSVSSLFTRGDMDLLLASPLKGRSILAVRALAVAISAALLPALMFVPFANVAPFAGMPKLLAMYPAVIAFGLLSAALAILLTMSLVKMLGVRRAKVTAQVMGAFIGAGAFLVSQAHNFLSSSTQAALSEWFKAESQIGGFLGPESVLWWPARAFMGDALPLFAFAVAGVGAFWFTVNLTFKRFITGTQETTTKRHKASTQPTAIHAQQFHRGLVSSLLWKEWKLILRDPHIISQTLLQVLYLVPMLVLGLSGKHASWLIIPGCVILTAMLVGNIAWLTLAAEDAPDIIGTSPVPIEKMRHYKALAALIPVWALLLPLVLYWLIRDPLAALILALCGGAATISSAMCHIWNPRKGDRRDIKTRHKQNMITSLIESVSAFGWAGVALCLGGYYWWVLLALPFAIAGPLYSWFAGAEARRSGVLA
jgi:ABC-2 type transport system permease protein